MTTADVVVVGGGIAGWSAAYFARCAGRDVTVVDEGAHRASDLPVGLINPLRGHAGHLVADGVEGMRASVALIEALRDAGHAVDAGRGLYRPLIDVPIPAREEGFWTARLAERLAFDWHPVAPSSLGLAEPVPALYLRDAAWVVARTLLDALRAASDAVPVADRVIGIARVDTPRDLRIDRGWSVALASGTTLVARTLLWCGGAWGAALLDRAGACDAGTPAPVDDGTYKPGSLVAVERCLTREPMSFGLYATPWRGPTASAPGARTLLGPTREGSQARFPVEPVASEVVERLGDRVARVFGTSMPVQPVWRGVRLARLSTAAGEALRGVPTLTSLGSRGFLMAPLLAARWARSL